MGLGVDPARAVASAGVTNARVARKADDGTRTRYLELGKLALYQVSYVREGAPFYAARGSVSSRSICSA